MLILWNNFLLAVGGMFFLNFLPLNIEVTSMIVVSLHLIITSLMLYMSKNKYKHIILIAFFLRFMFMMWDLYARSVFVLPSSGADSEYYFGAAFNLYSSQFSQFTFELYPNILGLLFIVVGPSRMFAQYVNVLLGVSVVLLLQKTLLVLKVNSKTMNIVLWVCALFPNSLIMSSILLREQFPTFFVAISLYYFVLWYQSGNTKFFILSFFLLLIGAAFHSGVIGILLGYSYMFLFYDRKVNRIRFTVYSIVSFILLSLLLLFISFYSDIFLRKFRNLSEISDIIYTSNERGGGSQYLGNLQMSNPLQLLLFSPIHVLFFFISPFPTDWRGFFDIFSFVFDSSLYLFVIILIIKNRKLSINNKTLYTGFLFMLIGAGFIFGVGVHNAGTAIRHRQKLLPLFLLTYALINQNKYITAKTKRNSVGKYRSLT